MSLCHNNLHDLSNPANAVMRKDGGVRCKPCRDKYNHEYYKTNSEKIRAQIKNYRNKNPDKVRSLKRAEMLRRRYGIGIEDYERLLIAQGSRCAVCGKRETARYNDGRVRRLAVDHDHGTGEVRGLLCSACNRRLGALVDDPDWLTRAMQYAGLAEKKVKGRNRHAPSR